jgi:4-hydroxybenzoate polyprenyltransferase
MRPRQWPKNLLLFAALLFSGRFLKLEAAGASLLSFICFLLLSSAVYAFNDALDRERDRHHPEKKKRPVASGRITPAAALTFAGMLALAGILLALPLHTPFVLSALGFIVLNLLYTFWFKHVVILDVFGLAAGFVVRAAAGAFAIQVVISSWLLVCTTFLSLLLALAKRRHELGLAGAATHRKALDEYSRDMVDQMITVAAGGAVMTYSLYAFERHAMLWTAPFVLYGIFRYLHLVHLKNMGGSPELVLLSDRPLQICIALWGISCAFILAN